MAGEKGRGAEFQGSPHIIQVPGNHELTLCLLTRLGKLYKASPSFDSSLAPQWHSCVSLALSGEKLCESQGRTSLSSSRQTYLFDLLQPLLLTSSVTTGRSIHSPPPASVLSTENGDSTHLQRWDDLTRGKHGRDALHKWGLSECWQCCYSQFWFLWFFQGRKLPFLFTVTSLNVPTPFLQPPGVVSFLDALGPHRLTDSPTGADASEVSSHHIGSLLSPKSMLLLWKKQYPKHQRWLLPSVRWLGHSPHLLQEESLRHSEGCQICQSGLGRRAKIQDALCKPCSNGSWSRQSGHSRYRHESDQVRKSPLGPRRAALLLLLSKLF